MLLGGVSASTISKLEKLNRKPSIDVLIGAEFIFGERARRLFPGVHSKIEAKITHQAALLAEELIDRTDKKSLAKRELLSAIAERVASDKPTI